MLMILGHWHDFSLDTGRACSNLNIIGVSMPKKILVLSLITTALLTGCGDNNANKSAAPLPLVQTQEVNVVQHQQSKSYIGRMDAVEDTAITAQVSGYLKERHFYEGQIVEKGQLLYSIEPSSFEAQVASANAQVSEAEATLKKSTARLRSRPKPS